MVTSYTDAGTPVLDLSDDEYRAFFDAPLLALPLVLCALRVPS